MILILGAGLAGIATSHHIGHDSCLVVEKTHRPLGHVASETVDGFTWDQGPHVSFTKHEYVRELFADGVDGAFEEYEVKVGNHYRGHWIDHPAQTALHQVPEPLRSECLRSFLESRPAAGQEPSAPADYAAWLQASLGPVFARHFPAVYTRKYWTVAAAELSTDWVGGRVLKPDPQDVIDGSRGPLARTMHYISKVRYPSRGGYQAFAAKMARGCRIRHGAEVVHVDLTQRQVHLASGERIGFTHLVNTLPLPVFLHACAGLPAEVRDAADALSCSQLMLVNAALPHATRRPEHWLYVYDDDMLSTRINFTERLSPHNAPPGWSGVQTEVYFSRHRPLDMGADALARRVLDELVAMGIADAGAKAHVHTRFAPWANVIFHHATAPALETIWRWLERQGLERSADDTHPLTDWSRAGTAPAEGRLFMAGRFGQWKYFWSDDCVLRGRQLGHALRGPGG
jgi:protoporphyrinogen oxidase